jgi:phage terminase large subunit-like protein
MVLFDELHAQPNDELWNVLTSGTDYARAQQLVIVLTTAGVYDRNSIWWKIHSRAVQVSKGLVEQPNFLPVLYIGDPEHDDPADEKLWARVNPSLGQIFTIEKVREDYGNAKDDPVEFQNFLRYRLNIPVKQLAKWMPMAALDKCRGHIDVESLKARRCYGGIDLSQSVDLSAFALVFPPMSKGEKTIALCRFYCPEENILERSRKDKVNYSIWAQQGFIHPTPGNVVDYEFIKADVLQAAKDFDLQEVGYDPRFASQFSIDLLNNHAVKMVEIPQLAKNFNEAMMNFLKLVMTEEVLIDNNAVLRWNFDNLVIRKRVDGSIQPDKEKTAERIDGAVAVFLAWGRMIFSPTVEKRSIYETRGIMILDQDGEWTDPTEEARARWSPR